MKRGWFFENYEKIFRRHPSSLIPTSLFIRARPALFLIYFRLFEQTLKFLLQIKVKKCPSSIWRWDLNPWPSKHGSSPITTRPGLPGLSVCLNEMIDTSGHSKPHASRTSLHETISQGLTIFSFWTTFWKVFAETCSTFSYTYIKYTYITYITFINQRSYTYTTYTYLYHLHVSLSYTYITYKTFIYEYHLHLLYHLHIPISYIPTSHIPTSLAYNYITFIFQYHLHTPISLAYTYITCMYLYHMYLPHMHIPKSLSYT